MKQKIFINHKGLTVIEMVIGFGLAVALMAMMVQTYLVTMRLSEKGLKRVEQLEEAQIVLEQIVRDLRSTIPFTNPDGNITFKLIHPQDNADSDKYIEFPAFIRSIDTTEQFYSRTENIKYSLTTSNRILRISQIMDSTISTTKSNETRPLGIGLSDTLYQLDISCFDQSTSTTGWVSEWQNRKNLPDMIKISVQLTNTYFSENSTHISRTVRLGGS